MIHFIEDIFFLLRRLSDRLKRRLGFIWPANQFYVCGPVCLRRKMGLFVVIYKETSFFLKHILPSFNHI